MSNCDEKTIQRFADIFKALSNPNRLSVFLRLVDCCGRESVETPLEDMPTCVGELCEGINVSPSTASHHLKELRTAGLIETKRKGQKVLCRVNPEVWDEMAGFFAKA